MMTNDSCGAVNAEREDAGVLCCSGPPRAHTPAADATMANVKKSDPLNMINPALERERELHGKPVDLVANLPRYAVVLEFQSDRSRRVEFQSYRWPIEAAEAAAKHGIARRNIQVLI